MRPGGPPRRRGRRAAAAQAFQLAAYCATKHALEGLTKAMALGLAPRGIRVNTLCPTFLLTPMTAPIFVNPEFRAKTLARIPLERLGTVEKLIDGGWTAI